MEGESCSLNTFPTPTSGQCSECTIFDLPECFPLIEKFVAQLHPGFRLGITESLPSKRKRSLVISDGALSEVTSPLVDCYLEHVVDFASTLYFFTNF